MKKLLVVLLLVFAIGYKASGQPFRKLNVTPGPYKIFNEDSLADDGGWKRTVSSDVKLKLPKYEAWPSFSEMKFSHGMLKGDTLIVVIAGGNAAVFHHYRIRMTRDKYTCKYRSLVSGGDEVGIVSDDFTLTVNSNDFKKGNEIRGSVAFHGRCFKNCFDPKIDLTGNFKVVIQDWNPDHDPQLSATRNGKLVR